MNDKSKGTVKKRLGQILKLLLVAALIGGLVYRMKFAPTPVIEHRVESGEIVSEIMGTGTLEARVKATISPKISGLLSNVLVDQGDRISKGDLLFELDNEELTLQVAIAEAGIAAKEAAIERLTANRRRDEAVLTQATQLLKRMQAAIATRSVSQMDLDKAEESFAVASAEIAGAEAGITEGQKELIEAQATLLYRRAGLDNTKVTAPFDGLIVRRQRDPGDIVLPGSAVLILVSTEQLWVSAWVDETAMAKAKEGQSARIVFRSEPYRFYKGEVARLGREADRETREFVIDVSLPAPSGNWAVGQRAEVYIESGRKDSALLIPSKFVQWRDETAGVFLHVGDRAEWRAIKSGLRNDEFIEVAEGLEKGDAIVISLKSKNKLEEGQRISVK